MVWGGWSGAGEGEAGFKPKTGKAALSRNEAGKNKWSDSGIVFACEVERREPTASGARALAAGSPKNEGGGRLPISAGLADFLL